MESSSFKNNPNFLNLTGSEYHLKVHLLGGAGYTKTLILIGKTNIDSSRARRLTDFYPND